MRSAAVIAALALLLIGGTLVERAERNAGCGPGERGILTQLPPLRGAVVTVYDNDLKDHCGAQYATRASAVKVLAHHADQLAAQGWRVKRDPLLDRPNLSAFRGANSVYIYVDPADPRWEPKSYEESVRWPHVAGREITVQLSASYHD